MIRFALICDNGHDFESWFASNESYDFQIEHNLVTCPQCSVAKINKAVMAPAVTRSRSRKKAVAPKQNVALIGEGDAELRQMARELHAKIVASTVDVGAEFPAEARKIHEGDAPERAIRGQASPEEARALLDDGVSILPIPILPDERS
jgi:hypothetical protein